MILQCVNIPISIEYRGYIFTGNQKDVFLEQFEMEGICIPYSCRSGFCATCKVKILSGSAVSLTGKITVIAPASILTCTSIPCGNVQLE
ncbi:ferredoxin [secondary endosymbiont of Heteropsylla cubana]|uniref:Ferredoxin n=1 Tax=secondary endosymbiont of Heteropsylla cubana TaxID=134287 RepID=J3VU11_9ENTR|nr:2Fe-2S iron-sulfur cluster binding domain-containing protein [secondary endosymbiont of Heteropsylla cubana]AFP85571.1 ferredoxin [secondary endosymbiont of Heteropsylla cubana]